MATTDILADLVDQALADVGDSRDLAALDEIRVRLLGKKGLLTEQLKSLGRLPASERPAAGQKINEAKVAIQAALEARRTRLDEEALQTELARGALDVTLPGRGQEPGSIHPVTRARLRIEPTDCRKTIAVAQLRALHGPFEHTDGFIVDVQRHREWVAILAAVRKRKACRIGKAGRRSVDNFRYECK